MSGIEAVRKIVETESQGRRIVEVAKTRAQEILSRASQDAEKARQEILAEAQRQREEILSIARVEAEAEAGKSEVETSQLLEGYRKALEGRKDLAVKKAVELILRG